MIEVPKRRQSLLRWSDTEDVNDLYDGRTHLVHSGRYMWFVHQFHSSEEFADACHALADKSLSSLRPRPFSSTQGSNLELEVGYNLEVNKSKLWWPTVDQTELCRPKITPQEDRVLLKPLPFSFLAEKTVTGFFRSVPGIKLLGATIQWPKLGVTVSLLA